MSQPAFLASLDPQRLVSTRILEAIADRTRGAAGAETEPRRVALADGFSRLRVGLPGDECRLTTAELLVYRFAEPHGRWVRHAHAHALLLREGAPHTEADVDMLADLLDG